MDTLTRAVEEVSEFRWGPREKLHTIERSVATLMGPVEPRWSQGGAASNHGGLRSPRKRSITPSRVSPPWLLRGAFAEPLWSFHQFNEPPVQRQLPSGRFHSESAIPSAQLCGVSIFGLGLRSCKEISTEPPRRHYGCLLYTSPSPRDS